MSATASGRGEILRQGGRRFERGPGLFARLFGPSFHKIVERVDAGLEAGAIHAQLPDGTHITVGGRGPGPQGEIILHDWRALLRLATNGSVGWFQAWEAGEWESPDPVPLFALFALNGRTLGDTGRAKGPWRLALKLAHLANRNTHQGARRNIQAHYDLGNDFYAAWLDELMMYSSARWEEWEGPKPDQRRCDHLTHGQMTKIETIQDRLDIASCRRVLEIGCGWGSAASIIASRGAEVDAVSISEEQLARARTALPAELRDSVRYLELDYRDIDGTYDAIYSIEMVEALGREHWPDFLDAIVRNLKPGGRAAIQYISMCDDMFEAYARSADFIQAYIFPGGLLIKTGEFRALAEERGLRWEDQADFGADYAETLALWRARFDVAVEEGRLPQGFDDKFVRLWRYYLMYCEGGFRGGAIDVHQVTLVKPA